MLDVISLGDYYCAINESEELPELRADVNAICGQRFRRIDRFIQLCLLGSARCAIDQHIDNQTGLYIGSRFAALGNTIAVHNQMFIDKQIPKPAYFINTLSNCGGYYVARNLSLTGKNLFVSRADASLEAALQIASLDLLSGQVEQALLGVVDEAVLPLAHHCSRMGIPSDTALGEGSHWFLLRRSTDTNDNKLATIHDVCLLNDLACLQDWLQNKQAQHPVLQLYCSPAITAQLNNLNLQQFQPPQTLNHYPARMAGVLLRFIEAQKPGGLITLQQDPDGRFHTTLTLSNLKLSTD